MAGQGIFRPYVPRRESPGFSPERNLAFAVIRQAWNEAVLDVGAAGNGARNEHLTLKQNAIEWFLGNNDGLLYWCQLAEMDHDEVRHKLRQVLRSQEAPGA